MIHFRTCPSLFADPEIGKPVVHYRSTIVYVMKFDLELCKSLGKPVQVTVGAFPLHC